MLGSRPNDSLVGVLMTAAGGIVIAL